MARLDQVHLGALPLTALRRSDPHRGGQIVPDTIGASVLLQRPRLHPPRRPQRLRSRTRAEPAGGVDQEVGRGLFAVSAGRGQCGSEPDPVLSEQRSRD